jgi:hypothetical protein
MSVVTFVGPAFDRLGHLHQAPRVCSPDELRDHHPARIPVDVDHQFGVIGEVVSLFRTRNHDVWATSVCDPPDWLLRGPVYYSPSTTMKRDGSDIEIVALAVTTLPATIGLKGKPLLVFDGDVSDAGQWFVNGKRPAGVVGEVVRDAREQWRKRHSRRATPVSGDNVDDDYPWGERLRGDEPPTGKLRRSAPGRVLAVY